jgi:hypothetical protein
MFATCHQKLCFYQNDVAILQTGFGKSKVTTFVSKRRKREGQREKPQ